MAKRSKSKEKWIVLTVVILISLSAIGFGTGYFQFFAAHIRCGKSPIMVESSSGFWGGSPSGYYTKDDGFHFKPTWDSDYFCTENEARKNGIKPGLFSRKNQ